MVSNSEDFGKTIRFPDPLKPGDKIALISPASAVKEEYVFGAIDHLFERGFTPVLMPYAIGHEYGSFSASQSNRQLDFLDVLEDPEIKAIFCTRGGYGCSQLIGNVSRELVANNPKWIIGFSDISALLALWFRSGIASIHGPMAKHLATMPSNDISTENLFSILEKGGVFDYKIPSHSYNRTGESTGVLRGGNLAVLNDMGGTHCDILNNLNGKEEIILFLEDISEPIYKVNRMLYRLLNNGFLPSLKGLIIGQFTEYNADRNYAKMEDMIHEFLQKNMPSAEIPVVFDFPVGHTDNNLPLVEGARVSLKVEPDSVTLKSI